MDLAAHQRALLELIEAGPGAAGADDDEYLRSVAASDGLRVLREIVAHWEAYDVRRTCPLTATALERSGRFAEAVGAVRFEASSAFLDERVSTFLDDVADAEGGVVASVARFERALVAVRRGEPGRHVIEWDRDPAVVVNGLLEGRWLADEAEPGRYRTVVDPASPELVTIELEAEATRSKSAGR